MKKKEKKVKFTNKGNSRRGIASLMLSAFSFIWLVYGIYGSFVLGDASGNELGGLGVLALILEVVALVFAVRALKEEDVFRGIPKTAVVLALVLLLLWASVYGLGIYSLLYS